MNDEAQVQGRGSPHDMSTTESAWNVLGAASRNRADAFVEKQTRLAELQIDTLQKKDEFELSHLRFRQYSDYARFSLEVAGFLVVLLIVCGLGTMVWNASQDRDLVVDAFSVPQDVAQTGLTGSVLAGRVLDRFGRMQAETFAFTQGAATYRADRADAVRVEIPQTGISIAELNSYLRAWLGHEVHISGDLVRMPGGGFALTTRYGGQPGATVTAKAADIDALTEKSAEQIFAAALPYRHVEYLVHKRRFIEASALLPDLVTRGSVTERATANAAWAKVYFFGGDIPHALERGREAVRLDPSNATGWAWLGATEGDLGHDERSYANLDNALVHFAGNSAADESQFLQSAMTAYRDELSGDYGDAVRAWAELSDSRPLNDSSAGSAAEDAAAKHDFAAARRFAAIIPARDNSGRPDPQLPLARMYIDLAQRNWFGAAKDGAASKAILDSEADQKWLLLVDAPDIAYAMARAGDLKGADALVAKIPDDCDNCVRDRGRIAALEHNPKAAARDFAMVAARSPREPFAETYWGEMLLNNGDYNGAIAKFAVANRKGPHFADPLEMWGEALMQKNRSDLALAKFEEANKYAPNWGRLHLKWGEALMYTRNKDAARAQFTVASRLDLSPSEKSDLSRVRTHRD